MSQGTGNSITLDHFIRDEDKCAVIYLSFRRVLNEAKAVYISEYYLACRFVIMTLRLRLKFRVTLNIKFSFVFNLPYKATT